MANGNEILRAIRLVLDSKMRFTAFLAIAVLLFFGYSYLLSSSSLNLSYPKVALGLNIYSLAISIVISAFLSLSLVMNAFAFANGTRVGGKVGLGAAVASIVPSSLCCTSVIPAILAAFGASTSTIIRVAGALQGPFATYETLFIAASIGLLLLSIFLVSRRIFKCCQVKR